MTAHRNKLLRITVLAAAFTVAACNPDTPLGPSNANLAVQADRSTGSAGVQVTPSSASLRPGENVQLTATATNDKGVVQVDKPVTWTTADPSIATVSSSGLVTGIAPGSVAVTVSTSGKKKLTGFATITVIPRVRFVVFTSDRDGPADIYSMNDDGSAIARLTSAASTNYHPSLSPDGTKIAFVSNRSGGPDIYAMNVDGTNQTRLTTVGAADYVPQWSPDGQRIVFISERDGFGAGAREVYVMNADGSNQQRVTSNSAIEGYPSWSPDGTKIVFESDRDGNTEIYVMNADGTNPARVTNNAAFDGQPKWSPDGSRIAFTSDRFGSTDILVINPDGNGTATVVANAAADENSSWSADGARIIFWSTRDGSAHIFSSTSNGADIKRISNGPGNDSYPTWR